MMVLTKSLQATTSCNGRKRRSENKIKMHLLRRPCNARPKPHPAAGPASPAWSCQLRPDPHHALPVSRPSQPAGPHRRRCTWRPPAGQPCVFTCVGQHSRSLVHSERRRRETERKPEGGPYCQLYWAAAFGQWLAAASRPRSKAAPALHVVATMVPARGTGLEGQAQGLCWLAVLSAPDVWISLPAAS